jgi:dTDP-4-amino-4,6-dideoxygalactose transaminase
MIGMNGKISEMNAGLGYLGMRNLERFVRRRNELFSMYQKSLEGCDSLQFQLVRDTDICTFKDMCIVFKGGHRDEVENRLRAFDVQSKRYFFPVHRMAIYRKLFGERTLEHTEHLADNSLCIPIFDALEDDAVEYVSSIIRDTVSI